MVCCKSCKRRISKLYIEMYTCKCKKVYCGNHLHSHTCNFDHVEEQQKILRERLPVVESDRGLVRI